MIRPLVAGYRYSSIEAFCASAVRSTFLRQTQSRAERRRLGRHPQGSLIFLASTLLAFAVNKVCRVRRLLATLESERISRVGAPVRHAPEFRVPSRSLSSGSPSSPSLLLALKLQAPAQVKLCELITLISVLTVHWQVGQTS